MKLEFLSLISEVNNRNRVPILDLHLVKKLGEVSVVKKVGDQDPFSYLDPVSDPELVVKTSVFWTVLSFMQTTAKVLSVDSSASTSQNVQGEVK